MSILLPFSGILKLHLATAQNSSRSGMRWIAQSWSNCFSKVTNSEIHGVLPEGYDLSICRYWQKKKKMYQYSWDFTIFYIFFSVLYLLAHLAVIAALKVEFDFLLPFYRCEKSSQRVEGIELICGRSGPEVWAPGHRVLSVSLHPQWKWTEKKKSLGNIKKNSSMKKTDRKWSER